MSHDRVRVKTVLCILWTILFLTLSLVPSLGMLFVGETQPSANETLASRPRLVGKDGTWNKAIFSDVSQYMTDRFAFRKQLITAWSALNVNVFHSSVESQVILGTDGWLYYEPTLDDYMGRSMTEEELSRAASYLLALQQEAESRGARFYFTIAPNKNSLYPSHMPSHIPSDHVASNAERLKPYLEQYGVHYIDLFSAFAAEEETLYYMTDSHWTDRGAALAADTILAAMGYDSSYFSGAFISAEPHRGDLYEMLLPTGSFRETAAVYSPGFSYQLSGDPNGGNAHKIISSCPGKEGTLLCWRDSFGISLYPYLADSFGSARFLRSSSYDLAEIERTGADFVLIELVERNLSQLAAAAK